MSRISSALTSSRRAFGSTPTRRTSRSVETPSSQTAGREIVESKSSGRARGQRPALGALHGDPLRGQLADDQREEGQHDGDQDDRHRLGGAAEEPQRLDQRLGQRDRRGGRGEEAGEGDADLDGGQVAVRVPGQPRQHPAPARGALQPPQLRLTQRHQRHLAAGEDRVEQHQDEHQHQPAAVIAHRPAFPHDARVNGIRVHRGRRRRSGGSAAIAGNLQAGPRDPDLGGGDGEAGEVVNAPLKRKSVVWLSAIAISRCCGWLNQAVP